MIKINHEVPLKYLDADLWFNDYEYALAHNFSDLNYIDHFRKAIKTGRTVYLDNSAFELGESVSARDLMACLDRLGGSAYVFLPDAVGDSERTLSLSSNFANKLKATNCPMWGVIQGQSNEEVDHCLKEMVKITHNIALPYRGPDRYEFVVRNIEFIRANSIKVHLLGVNTLSNLIPLGVYSDIITSVDTSLPVVLGFKDIKMGYRTEKPKEQVWELTDNYSSNFLPKLAYINAAFFRASLRKVGL